MTGHTGVLTSLAFNADGKRLAAGSRNGTVQIYALRLEDLIKIAQSKRTRALTIEECQKYVHVATCPFAPWFQGLHHLLFKSEFGRDIQ